MTSAFQLIRHQCVVQILAVDLQIRQHHIQGADPGQLVAAVNGNTLGVQLGVYQQGEKGQEVIEDLVPGHIGSDQGDQLADQGIGTAGTEVLAAVQNDGQDPTLPLGAAEIIIGAVNGRDLTDPGIVQSLLTVQVVDTFCQRPTGIFIHIAVQVVLNIMVVTNMIPTTGITLPFISYGGTSILFLMAEMALALGISRQIRFNP